MLTFAHPWLALLLPLPWLIRRILPPHREPTVGLRVPFLDRLGRLTGQEPEAGGVILVAGSLHRWARLATWLCLVVSLARPQWLGNPVTRTVPTRDLMLAVDLSASMGTKDFTDPAGRKIDRLSAVKEVLDGFLARRKGDRVGLIVFGNAPFVQVPFTEDLDACRELLAETRVGMAGPKTALGDAIGLAVTLFRRSDAPERVLIALTDGNDTGSQVPPDQAARVALDQHIVIHTVAVSDPRAAGEEALDVEALRCISAATGGLASFATDRRALAAVYDRLDRLPSRPAQTISRRPRRELFPWPLGVGFMLSLGEHALGLLRSSRRPAAPARASLAT